jgi:hypothetical protein
MMKKTLLASALLSAFASSALAGDATPVVKLGGYLDTQAGYRSQKRDFRFSTPTTANSGKLNDFAIVNDTQIFVNVDGKDDTYGFTYGGLVKLFADTSKSKHFRSGSQDGSAFQTVAYFEGVFGRLEAGNYTGVTKAFKVDATSFARATGGANGDSKYWWNQYTAKGVNFATKTNFIETPNLYTNEEGQAGARGVNAAKVNYYTPDYYGFKLGASYTPDLQSYGTIAQQSSITKTIGDADAATFRNIWEGGIYYAGQFNDVGFKAAVLGQTGTAKKVHAATDKKFRDLSAWEAGANVSYMGFTLGGSYGDWGKSGKLKTGQNKASTYWTAGLGYEYGAFGVSLDYFESKLGITNQVKKNKLEKFTLGVDYKLAPGLLPYAEVSAFKFHDHAIVDDAAVKSNKGTIFLVGSKLQF